MYLYPPSLMFACWYLQHNLLVLIWHTWGWLEKASYLVQGCKTAWVCYPWIKDKQIIFCQVSRYPRNRWPNWFLSNKGHCVKKDTSTYKSEKIILQAAFLWLPEKDRYNLATGTRRDGASAKPCSLFDHQTYPKKWCKNWGSDSDVAIF